MSHPPKVRSVSSASGTNFLMSGERASVRLPRRMVPICVSDPTGCDSPLRTSSTPAMKVVLTAPIPGSNTPNLPLAGAIFPGFFMQLLLKSRSHQCNRLSNAFKKQSYRAGAFQNCKQTSNDERSASDLQIHLRAVIETLGMASTMDFLDRTKDLL